MPTVPQPQPSDHFRRTVADVFGDRDTTPALPSPWQHTCAQVSAALRTQHAGERLGKALALAQGGAVELEDSGFAVVISGTKLYHVQADGRCDCPDYAQRGAPCKHVLAVLIHTKAQALLASSPSAATEPAAPTATPPKRQARPRSNATAAPAPTAPTSATWQVHEAPTSACFRFRLGQGELTYTFRGVNDTEVLDRIHEHLPFLQAILDGWETRAAERAAARDAVQAQQAPAPTAPTFTPDALQALQALLTASPATSNGPAATGPATGHTPAPLPRCPAHGAMRESTKAPGTWFCTQKLPNGKYCPSKA